MICGFQSFYEFGKELCKILNLPESSCFEEILSAVKELKSNHVEINNEDEYLSLATLYSAIQKYLKRYSDVFSNRTNYFRTHMTMDKIDNGQEYIKISFPNKEFFDINIYQTRDPYVFMIFDHTKSGLPQGLGQQSIEDVVKYIKNKLERNNL